MAKLNMNVEKIIECGEELKTIGKDYDRLIDETYKKLTKISENSVLVSENSNGAANKFIQSAELDKKNVTPLGTNIYNLGEKLVMYANNIKNISEDNIGG